MKILLSLLPVFLLILTSCSDGPEEAFVPPPVGILDTGSHLVTLHSTPENPVYTIEDKEGNLMARHLSREDFAAQFPEIFQEINGLWAGNRRSELEADPMSKRVFDDLLSTE